MTIGVFATLSVAGIVVSVVLLQLHAEKVYGKVGDHKIYQSELTNTLVGAVNIPQSKAVTTLLDYWLYQQIAKKEHLSISSEEVNSELKSRTGSLNPPARNYLVVAIKRDLLYEKITAAAEGFYTGDMIIVHFDQNIPFGSGFDSPASAIKIASDRKYAQTFVSDIYNQLKSGRISFAQAIIKEQTDPRVGIKALPTTSHSGSFDTSKPQALSSQVVARKDVKTEMLQLKPGSYSAPFIAQVDINASVPPAKQDGYFVIIKMATSQSLASNLKVDEYIASQKLLLKYEQLQ